MKELHEAASVEYVLVPGAHHLLTRRLAQQIRHLTAKQGGLDGSWSAGDRTYIWAVTGASHHGTRGNPIPLAKRIAAIELFSQLEQLRSVVVEVDDVAGGRLADVVIKTVEVETRGKASLHPGNTLIVPADVDAAEGYRELGFAVAEPPAERTDPASVIARLAAGDGRWRAQAHVATLDVYDRYWLAGHITRIFADRILGAEGSLTRTRDYTVYKAAMDKAAARKWRMIRRHVRPGRVVDLGCGPGALLEHAAADPALEGSDLYGVEISRHLFQECLRRKAEGAFSNPSTYFLHANIISEEVFPPASVNTTVTSAVAHEIYSYGNGRADVLRLARAIADQTAPGGVWINYDVCAPDEPDRIVDLILRDKARGAKPVDLSPLDPKEVGQYLDSLTPADRFPQFARDFRVNAGVPFEYERIENGFRLRLADAMEFLRHCPFTASWLSETHERYCALNWSDWQAIVREAGLEPDGKSGAWVSKGHVGKVYSPMAELRDSRGSVIPWPATHMTMRAGHPRT